MMSSDATMSRSMTEPGKSAQRISLAEAKAIAKKPSDIATPGRQPNLAPLPALSSKSQLELMNLIKEGKVTQDGALEWAQERHKRETVPKLTNEQQLELLNKVKLGRISIEEALTQAATQVSYPLRVVLLSFDACDVTGHIAAHEPHQSRHDDGTGEFPVTFLSVP